jgi:uncharacterized lipoprotein YmbA
VDEAARVDPAVKVALKADSKVAASEAEVKVAPVVSKVAVSEAEVKVAPVVSEVAGKVVLAGKAVLADRAGQILRTTPRSRRF